MYESLVQVAALVLVGRAEVEIVELLVPFANEVSEEKVESSVGSPFLSAGDVLHVGHPSALEDDHTCCDASLVAHDVEPDVPGETCHELLHLQQSMRGAAVVILLQNVFQQSPELAERLEVAFRHAVDVEAVLHGFLGLPHAKRSHLHRVAHRHASAHQPTRQSGSGTEKCVEVLARRDAAIYIRYGFIDEAFGLHHVAIVSDDGLHHVHHLLLCHLGQNDKSAIGQPLVGMDGAVLLVPIGREHSHKVLRGEVPLLVLLASRNASIDEHRAVEETVGMVVHEAPLEQERAVLRHVHKRIPCLLAIYRIWYNRHESLISNP